MDQKTFDKRFHDLVDEIRQLSSAVCGDCTLLGCLDESELSFFADLTRLYWYSAT